MYSLHDKLLNLMDCKYYWAKMCYMRLSYLKAFNAHKHQHTLPSNWNLNFIDEPIKDLG